MGLWPASASLGPRGVGVAILDSLSDVGVFVKDSKKAREFYTRTMGLKVRSSMPKMGYLALGATKGGDDASLNVWQPAPSWGSPQYEEGLKQIGSVTGIGFVTTSYEKTMDGLKRRGAKVETMPSEGGAKMGSVRDPDGNSVFVLEPPKPKRRRPGLHSLEFITIASRDAARTGEFFVKALGMKRRSADEGMTAYRLTSEGTALMPFTPTREMYDNDQDYNDDMAHIGEPTSIMFTTKDIYKAQEALMARGVRFSKKAEKAEWGGIQAEFLDPDDNRYALVQMSP